MRSSTTLPRTNTSTASSYLSDAAAIKAFYTAVGLVNDQDIQARIHQAMDTMITLWTKRYDALVQSMNELEYDYATLQHEAQAESTMYHKCMRDLQFYKAKCDLITYTGSQKQQQQQQQHRHVSSSALLSHRPSYLSMDSCGRSTVTSNTSRTVYSRSTDGDPLSSSSSSSTGYHASFNSFYSPPPSSIASSRRPSSSVSSTQVAEDDSIPGDDDKASLQQKDKFNDGDDDTFDIASIFEHCYPSHIPSPKPPPADDLPLPLPPPPPLVSSDSPKHKIIEPEPVTSTIPTAAQVSVPDSPLPKTQGRDIHTPPSHPRSSHVPSPVIEELTFACGDGFWHTIAKGKSNKEQVETLIKNYLQRGGQPNVANNSGTIKSVKEGYGLIHALVVVRNTNALRRILEAGANPNVFPLVTNDKDKICPLVLAASLGYMNGVRLLVERAKVNVLTSKGPKQKNALLAAIEVDAFELVMYLLKVTRTLLDQVDETGATPLHYACMAGKTRMITFLVKECGQICDAVDYKGETPLHYALRYKHPQAAAMLVNELGADPNVIKKMTTPLELAKSGGLRPLMAMVRTINNNLK